MRANPTITDLRDYGTFWHVMNVNDIFWKRSTFLGRVAKEDKPVSEC